MFLDKNSKIGNFQSIRMRLEDKSQGHKTGRIIEKNGNTCPAVEM